MSQRYYCTSDIRKLQYYWEQKWGRNTSSDVRQQTYVQGKMAQGVYIRKMSWKGYGNN